jgi:polyphosphate kinase
MVQSSVQRRPAGRPRAQQPRTIADSIARMSRISHDAQPAVDLRSPEFYFNRELSALEFNRRVLAQAEDDSMPLLERLRFLCIVSTNLDEFFEIRVAGLKQQVAFGASQRGPDQLGPQEQLRRISEVAHALVDQQYRVLNEQVLPELEATGVRFLRRSDWTPRQARWVRRHFLRELVPVITPVGLDPAHPFPRVLNKSLNFVALLEGRDAFGRDCGTAVVQAPRSLPRLIRVPAPFAEGPYDFVFLSSVIHAHVGDLFPGMDAEGCFQFRVTRNSDLFVDDEEVEDLLRALEGELPARRFGDAVRLEVSDNCPVDTAAFLQGQFRLQPEDVYRVSGPVNLSRLAAVYDSIDRPELKFVPFTPSRPLRVTRNADLFDVIRRGDLLLHHPYQSFAPVVDLLRQAAADPDVLTIKQTLYRTGSDSAIVAALCEAARNGKEVVVVVELRARFDEEANIDVANTLQEAGALVVYGVVDYKTHAKMVLIVRREENRLRRYVHLGTGNYHVRTARLYTDFSLMTCDRVIGEDVHRIFLQLTSVGRAGKLRKLLQSPFTLHRGLLSMVSREASHARAGRPARIIAKMNALIEPQIIQALYEASRAGVQIDLIVRGVCALRPGVPGVSENIRVRSIVGRFLEHARVFWFANDGDEALFISSADWMGRNFFNRVETCAPLEDKRLRARVLNECLMAQLADNTAAWLLQPDGNWERASNATGALPRNAQRELLELHCDLPWP